MSELSKLLLEQSTSDENNASDDFFDKLRRLKLQAAISAESIANNKGFAGGGRVGVNYPIENGSVGFGVSGGGAYIPKEKVRDFRIDRLDANYDNWPNSVSVDFDPNDIKRNFMINFRRAF